MFLVDSHCHFDLLDLSKDEINNVIQRAQENSVAYFLNVCVKIADFPRVLSTAQNYPFVFASVGLHPNETNEEIDEAALIKLAQPQKVLAIGETGLDYFRSSGEVEWQRERFRTHIRAAKKIQKPLIIHTRNAKQDTIKIMQEEGASEAGGVIHCFTEDFAFAKQALDLGFYISFSGIVTFKNAAAIQEAAKQIPLDRMLVETDSPYLAPNPHRGKENEPAYLRHTAEYLAALRNISLQEMAEHTTENFFKLFKGAVKSHV
jgi:TatD DNase family protein